MVKKSAIRSTEQTWGKSNRLGKKVSMNEMCIDLYMLCVLLKYWIIDYLIGTNVVTEKWWFCGVGARI